MHTPAHILLISGKRKCGKDFVAEALLERLNTKAAIVRISEPLKSQYALRHNLDLQALMGDGPYKETHRKNMITWSDSVRLMEPGYFCQVACENAPHCNIWIVSDIRRKSDIQWFRNQFRDELKTLRITADDAARQQRGWRFVVGVDDVTSECDLDDYQAWDLLIHNDGHKSLHEILDSIENLFNV